MYTVKGLLSIITMKVPTKKLKKTNTGEHLRFERIALPPTSNQSFYDVQGPVPQLRFILRRERF